MKNKTCVVQNIFLEFKRETNKKNYHEDKSQNIVYLIFGINLVLTRK